MILSGDPDDERRAEHAIKRRSFLGVATGFFAVLGLFRSRLPESSAGKALTADVDPGMVPWRHEPAMERVAVSNGQAEVVPPWNPGGKFEVMTSGRECLVDGTRIGANEVWEFESDAKGQWRGRLISQTRTGLVEAEVESAQVRRDRLLQDSAARDTRGPRPFTDAERALLEPAADMSRRVEKLVAEHLEEWPDLWKRRVSKFNELVNNHSQCTSRSDAIDWADEHQVNAYSEGDDFLECPRGRRG